MTEPIQALTIDEALIVSGLQAETAADAIRALAERLQRGGYVLESYAEAVLAREQIYPTGLPTEIPVALPHTDVQHCLKPAVAVGLLTGPVTFGMMGSPGQTVGVQTILALSVTEPKAQVSVLTGLIEFCQRPAQLRSLHAASTPREAADLLRHGLGLPPAPTSTSEAPGVGGEAAEIVFTIGHPSGLHARPAAKFVQTAARFKSEIKLSKPDSGKAPVNAKSILAVLTLGVQSGQRVQVQAIGPDAAEALDALQELVQTNFGDT